MQAKRKSGSETKHRIFFDICGDRRCVELIKKYRNETTPEQQRSFEQEKRSQRVKANAAAGLNTRVQSGNLSSAWPANK